MPDILYGLLSFSELPKSIPKPIPNRNRPMHMITILIDFFIFFGVDLNPNYNFLDY